MTEAEFEQTYRASLMQIEEAIERAIDADDIDLDYETVNDILTLECEDGSSIIITKQSATQQLWLAAKSGGFHFEYSQENKAWLCTQQAQSFLPMLENIILQQGNIKLVF